MEKITIVYYVLAIILAGFTILYRIKLYEYLKKIGKWLIFEIKKIIVFVQEAPRLWTICAENSRNYRSMIIFRPERGSIEAEDSNLSPYLRLDFSIANFSIFDFKTKEVSIKASYNRSELDPIVTEGKDVLHQQVTNYTAKSKLHEHFIKILKSLKKEGKNNSIELNLQNVKLDFIGDKEFRIPYGDFILEIPMNAVHVTL
ncbi:MAG: hypothetical protein OIN88_06750 [Candidatus Methanoperedens sp.]|nr:hypothetical protein [Candidatus Methanoperedens sp.]HLB70077.1 hypothetical protein [Candidatus Methanoperedens sp.]